MPQQIRVKPADFKVVFGKKLGTILFVAFALLAIAVAYTQTPTTPQPDAHISLYNELNSKQQFFTDPLIATSRVEQALVTEIVDGDTIRITSNGKTYTVRYIGIDTPEIKHQGNSTDQPYGQEATALNAWLVSGKEVYLKKDVTETDKYGRLLRYVFLPNGTLVNSVIVRMGYAHILSIPPNVAFQSEFLQAQQAAREEGLNLWH